VIVAGRDMGRMVGREGLLRSKGSGVCSELEGMLEEDSRAEEELAWLEGEDRLLEACDGRDAILRVAIYGDRVGC
jgi:hypothetical protein